MYAKTTRHLKKITTVFVVFKVTKGISDYIMLTDADLNIRSKHKVVVCDNGQKIEEKIDTGVAIGK